MLTQLRYLLGCVVLIVCCFLFYSKFPTETITLVFKSEFFTNQYFNKSKKYNIVSKQWLNTSENLNFSNYGDNSCDTLHQRQHLLVIFERWVKLANKYNISYFLTAGSLLGAWRNQDFIPYDRDLDILISNTSNTFLESIKDQRNFHESDDKFHLVLQEDWTKPYAQRRRFKCNGEQVKVYSDHCSFQEPLGRLIKGDFHLDIYDYTVKDDLIYDPSEWEKTYKIADVFPLTKCMFMNIETWCPKYPKVILNQLYNGNLFPSRVCKNGKWIV